MSACTQKQSIGTSFCCELFFFVGENRKKEEEEAENKIGNDWFHKTLSSSPLSEQRLIE